MESTLNPKLVASHYLEVSWVVISGARGRVTIIITHIRGRITLLGNYP